MFEVFVCKNRTINFVENQKHMEKPVFTIEQIAKFHGVIVERIKAQYTANAQGLERMYNKAVETGKKVGGYTADQIKAKVEEFKALAA